MHGELGSSRIEENPHAATWGAGLVQEVIPQVGEMSLRRAGGICPHDDMEVQLSLGGFGNSEQHIAH